MIRKIIFSFCMLAAFAPVNSFGDVVEEGETDIYFKVINLADFGDYEFFYYFQDYYYDHGYQPGNKIFTLVEEGEEFLASDRYDRAVLMARLKSDTTKIFMTTEEFGGNEIVGDRRVERIVEEIKIKAISNDTIKVKVKRYNVRENGDRIETEGGFLGGIYGGPFQFFGINGLILLLPLAALLSLVIFFLWRRNLNRKMDASSVA